MPIRPLRSSDAGGYNAALDASRPELSAWTIWCPADPAIPVGMDWFHDHVGISDDADEWAFAIVDDIPDTASDDHFLGVVGFHRIDRDDGIAELGYWVRSDRAGEGVATGAARLALDWFFSRSDMHAVEILVNTTNDASNRVCEKLGASRIGGLADRIRVPGGRADATLWQVTRRRWLGETG